MRVRLGQLISDLFLTRGERIGDFMIFYDKGEVGFKTPPFVAYIICEQPLKIIVFNAKF